jgi:type IV secretory pathway TrbL component
VSPPYPFEADPDPNALRHQGRESTPAPETSQNGPESVSPAERSLKPTGKAGENSKGSEPPPAGLTDASPRPPSVAGAESTHPEGKNSGDASPAAGRRKAKQKKRQKTRGKATRKARSKNAKKKQAANKRSTRQRLWQKEGRKPFVLYVTADQEAALRW